uniref:Uncharacterized protein n=1 Tax=Anguilla anguilla TaxID=7936 RepID=A0A0E9S0Y6_ANGAN
MNQQVRFFFLLQANA